jgi:hypothetical protein
MILLDPKNELWCCNEWVSLRTVLSAPNEFSLPNCVVCSDEFSLPNCVFHSESGVRCRIVLSVANEFSLSNCVSTEYRHHGGLKNLSLERTDFWHPILWLRSRHLVLWLLGTLTGQQRFYNTRLKGRYYHPLSVLPKAGCIVDFIINC